MAAMDKRETGHGSCNGIFRNYPDVVSPSDLCAMLGISKNTAYGLLKSGEIKSRRMGKMYKIPKQEVIDFLTNNSQ